MFTAQLLLVLNRRNCGFAMNSNTLPVAISTYGSVPSVGVYATSAVVLPASAMYSTPNPDTRIRQVHIPFGTWDVLSLVQFAPAVDVTLEEVQAVGICIDAQRVASGVT